MHVASACHAVSFRGLIQTSDLLVALWASLHLTIRMCRMRMVVFSLAGWCWRQNEEARAGNQYLHEAITLNSIASAIAIISSKSLFLHQTLLLFGVCVQVHACVWVPCKYV